MDVRKGKFRRETLCELADWKDARFKSARNELNKRRREEFGSAAGDIERLHAEDEQLAERVDRPGWGTFGFFDALALMVMDDFAGREPEEGERNSLTRKSAKRDGVSLWTAYRIFRNNAGVLSEYWSKIVEGKTDVFIGHVWLGPPDGSAGGYNVGGTLLDVAAKIARGHWAGRDPKTKKIIFEPDDNLNGVVLVNVTYTFKRLLENARKVGIEVPSDFLVTPPSTMDLGF